MQKYRTTIEWFSELGTRDARALIKRLAEEFVGKSEVAAGQPVNFTTVKVRTPTKKEVPQNDNKTKTRRSEGV